MRIAIVGSGISGLTSAYLLNQKHDISLFEADSRLGGHTATIDVEEGDKTIPIDTGFIVFNDWTYPNFIKLMSQLGVESQPTDMGFSVSALGTGPNGPGEFVKDFEYAGNNLNSLFAQRRNLLDGGHWRMLRDIVRFNRDAVTDWKRGQLSEATTLGTYLDTNGYSAEFASRYLVPMGSAIWSASMSRMLDFSVDFFVRFFYNHGLLNIFNRPQWRVIRGGSKSYIAPMIESFKDRIHLSSPVQRVTRVGPHVRLEYSNASDEKHTQEFDQVIFACHSDQTLNILGDASTPEREILGHIPYEKNSVVLHTDTSLLPKRQSAWASWNYRLQGDDAALPALTYNMNILQRLETSKTYCVTLNADHLIDQSKIIGEYEYEHPQFSVNGNSAQARWGEINGVNRTWFCGAYWANGFHEDGVVSAVRVAKALGVDF
ncbi:NAD(P)/FAD-dependent oxidoreductase [Microbulbifer agarilyticus]|uniref:NAD(P)/FAD-dependent oxidoreductase n=1 Tax=Microbulbifer agarilyticus TaxID=260552 RepID=UPI001CD7D925|nr:FAD-dependent oxidoreductase [Microbulbifer agarilyticus]MCA0900939.1 FAD-dependent oxidoreductase [Microbulbifer agarilyticus]